MQRSNARQKSLFKAAGRYAESLPGSPAERYLADRGIANYQLAKVSFGYVEDPEPEHSGYRGMLAIPYLRRSQKGVWSVASIRFRCLKENCDHYSHPGGKYATVAGDKPLMYNTPAMVDHHDRIAITEGELDAVSATLAGVPAVGIAGAQVWKSKEHYSRAFAGYEKVYVLADGDDAGKDLMTAICESLSNAVPCQMPPGKDVNSFILGNGPEALKERIGW